MFQEPCIGVDLELVCFRRVCFVDIKIYIKSNKYSRFYLLFGFV